VMTSIYSDSKRKLVARVEKVQLARLEGTFPERAEINNAVAVGRAWLACSSAPAALGVPFAASTVALELTAGPWLLVGLAGVIGCFGMNQWRRHQSKRVPSVGPR
jgi:hypothetical protein